MQNRLEPVRVSELLLIKSSAFCTAQTSVRAVAAIETD